MLWLINTAVILIFLAACVLLLIRLRSAGQQIGHWKIEASTHLGRARAWKAQAEAFERAGKAKDEQLALCEEHITAERQRAERLAGELQKAEDKLERANAVIEQLNGELENAKDDKRELQLQLLKAMRDVMSGTVLDEAKRRGEAPVFNSAISEQEWANIFAYNGSGQGQVDLNDE